MLYMLATVVLGLATIASYGGHGVETVLFSVEANQLKGDVYCCEAIAPDNKVISPGQTIDNVAILECHSHFRNCIEVARTDQTGRFAIKSRRKAKVHYLKFVSPGFNQSWVTVTLKRRAKPLHIGINVGT